MPKVANLFVVALMTLLFQGCTNPYSKYYVDKMSGVDIANSPYFQVGDEPEVMMGNDPELEETNRIC